MNHPTSGCASRRLSHQSTLSGLLAALCSYLPAASPEAILALLVTGRCCRP